MKTFDLGPVTAYALAVKNGFKGTEQEWLTSLVPELSVGEVKTLEAGSNAAVVISGTPENPVLNLSLPRGENGHAADWNQNDPTQPEYVQNRTHYEAKEVVEILPESTLPYAEDQSAYSFGGMVESVPALAVGETYIVVWNGVEYRCVGQDASKIFVAGAVGLGDATGWRLEGNGEPFVVCVLPNTNVLARCLDGSAPAEVTVAIRQEQTTIVPLPAKYLPKGVPYAGDAEVPFNFTFDGDTTGKEVIEVYEGVGYVKVADIVLTRDDLTNAVMTMMSADEEIIYEFDLESIIDVNGDGSIFGGGEYVLAVQRDSEMSGLAFAPGLYFINYPGVYLVKSLIKEGATVTEEVINKLDSRCLPDGLPYIEESLVEILPKTTSAVSEEGSTSAMTAAAKMIVGETYTVNYNGVEYETKLVSIEIDEGYSLTFFGNASMFDAADTGEPFMGSYVEGADVVSFMPLDGATEVTASIKGKGKTIHKLDSRCLPTDATELYLTSPGGEKFKITVSDDGVLSAAEATD